MRKTEHLKLNKYAYGESVVSDHPEPAKRQAPDDSMNHNWDVIDEAYAGLASPRPLLSVNLVGDQAIPGMQFTPVKLSSNIAADTHGGWNPQTCRYTIPVNGIYRLSGKYRLADGIAAGISCGLGLADRAEDIPSFLWATTYPYRQSVLNTTIQHFTAGTEVFMYVYVDAAGDHPLATGVFSAELLQRTP